MDLSMPGVDGIEATRQIAASGAATRVVVLTSLADDRHIGDALEAGAIGYVLKHAGPDDLIGAIRAAAAGDSPLDPKAARVLLEGRRGRVDRQLIARKLQISERTVKAHLTNIFARLGVTDRTQAALWAQEHLPPEG
jgi:DNA-binding NarL/FixJ family response regulator